jgi:hypothetical protein
MPESTPSRQVYGYVTFDFAGIDAARDAIMRGRDDMAVGERLCFSADALRQELNSRIRARSLDATLARPRRTNLLDPSQFT